MNGFVAQPPTNPPAPDPLDQVAGDAFWPALSIAEFRDAMAIAKSVADTRVRDALRGGMAHVRRELRAWKAGHVAAGAATLGDVDDEEIDGEGAAELLYRRAVFCVAAADIAETHGEVSATIDGRDRIAEERVAAGELRRNATHAIRDILGVTRTSVELI
ncbi:MAG TPA: head completion/stabilization protein [Croceibacterium sp.]|nr:head completion/stabilization protein [Croceibacterium sp.]